MVLDGIRSIPSAEIDGLSFGMHDDAGVMLRSVVRIESDHGVCTKRNTPVLGSVHDTRLGTVFKGVRCSTCAKRPERCGGHRGHVELHMPVFPAVALHSITRVFGSICVRCSSLLVPNSDLMRHEPRRRLLEAHTRSKKVTKCTRCGQLQPIAWIICEKVLVRPVWASANYSPVVTPHHLYLLLENVTSEDQESMGFIPHINDIMSQMQKYFSVPPLIIRPPRSHRSEDDITSRLRLILKANTTAGSKVRHDDARCCSYLACSIYRRPACTKFIHDY